MPEPDSGGAGLARSAEVVLFLPVENSITNALNRQISQEVCPHNGPKFVQITSEEAFWPRQGVHGAKLIELMGMDQAELSRRFRSSPVKRTTRRGLRRNVAVAPGNWGRAEVEEDSWVREEILLATSG